jgi:predicted nucleic acid-binding protein
VKIYLDNCAIQRPLDDQTNLRNRIETEAIMGVFGLIEQDILKLMSSDVLVFEISNSLDADRIYFGLKVLSLSKQRLRLTDKVILKAKELEKHGLDPIDALHLSVALTNRIRYFITCDDRFLKKARTIKNISTTVLLPTEFIKEFEK